MTTQRDVLPDPERSGAPALVVRTVEVDDDPGLLAALPGRGGACWVHHQQGCIAYGVAARFTATGDQRFTDGARWWSEVSANATVRDEVDIPGSGLVALGSFGFDAAGESALVVPRLVLARRAGRSWITSIAVRPSLPPDPREALARGHGVDVPSGAPAPPQGLTFSDGARTGADWEGAVAEAVSRIGRGALDKVVLARDLVAQADESIDLRWPLRRLAERYPACWTYSIDGLFGATPEMLVRLESGLVTSRVLAGTIRRTGDDTRDLALAASLARSSKDLEEHEYAVRSVAESLAPYCSGTNVPEAPFVLHLPNVMHLATDVTGVLTGPGTAESPLELAAALHPTAAVCGTPTETARGLIRELELMDRGRYAGPVGWIDGAGNGEWGIALRCAQLDEAEPTRLRAFAGCGIVAESDPAAELAESQAKLVPIRDALQD